MVFFRLWETVLGKWYIFKCFSACMRPFRVSWSPFLTLHRLSSFRICSPDVQAFVVFSMSSVVTFFPGKLSIKLQSCSKVRFMCPRCRCTLFSQRSISAQSKSRDSHTMYILLVPPNYTEAKARVITLTITFSFMFLGGVGET